jgi:sulfatase maturation enzyme AslB (radical SAM superfamily)
MKKNKLASFHDQIYSFFNFDNVLQSNETFCRNITIQVTENCNLACTYCYEKHKTKKMMNKETAKAIIDLLFKMYEDDNDPFINH